MTNEEIAKTFNNPKKVMALLQDPRKRFEEPPKDEVKIEWQYVYDPLNGSATGMVASLNGKEVYVRKPDPRSYLSDWTPEELAVGLLRALGYSVSAKAVSTELEDDADNYEILYDEETFQND